MIDALAKEHGVDLSVPYEEAAEEISAGAAFTVRETVT